MAAIKIVFEGMDADVAANALVSLPEVTGTWSRPEEGIVTVGGDSLATLPQKFQLPEMVYEIVPFSSNSLWRLK
jgi:hypothetical protein